MDKRNETGILPDGGKNAILEETEERLNLFEEAMKELIRLSGSVPEKNSALSKSEMTYIYTTLTDDLCRKCPKFRECFGERQENTLQEIASVMRAACRTNHVEGSMASKEFRKRCVYFQPLIDEMSWLFRRLYQNHYWENRLTELRQVMQKQMASQYCLLRECRKMLTDGRPITGKKRRKMKRALFRQGISFLEGREYEDENSLLDITLIVKPLPGPKKTDGIARALSEIYQKSIRYSQTDLWLRSGKNRLTFVEEGSFRVLFGRKHCNKEGEEICGDNFSFTNYNKKRAVMLLSDGMGVGERAHEGSRKLIEAFESMLEAGICEEYALEILHNSLLMDSHSEFSTLDIAVISLKTGTLKMMKAGGTATFICHGQDVERISPESLPPGCMVNQQFELKCKKLYDGDMVVMVSDGMLDFETMPEIPFRMEHILKKIRTNNAQSFADRLMEAIPVPDSGHDDDRTVLVASVWEKGRINVG